MDDVMEDVPNFVIVAIQELHQQFLVVLAIRPGRQIVCYGLPVAGINHRREATESAVIVRGCKLSETTARKLFSEEIDRLNEVGFYYSN